MFNLNKKGLFRKCPKTGRIVGVNFKNNWAKLLYPLIGLLALLWFLIRVIPRPSRASYPCQRVAASIAAGFIAWIAGLIGSVLIFKKARTQILKANYWLAGGIIVVGILFTVIWSTGLLPGKVSAYTLSDGPNSPMGVARGVCPGRVAWVWDPNATSYVVNNGYWWDDNNTNQTVVDSMVSNGIKWVADASSETVAWDAIFKNFNQRRGKGAVGYQAGEKFAIKINQNNARNGYAPVQNLNGTPAVILALIRQLVNIVKVNPADITVYDASRYIQDNIYNKIHNEFPGVQFVDQAGTNGRVKVQWVTNAIPYSVSNTNGHNLPTCVVQASYLIDMALMKGHGGQGVTFCGKNHFGTINSISHASIGNSGYNTFTDFFCHKDLGEKTLLGMVDALYCNEGPDGAPTTKWKMAPFNNDWCSSLFISMDEVAVDSVAFDFIRNEWPNLADLTNCDNYLHEAALADNPPSGTFYDPEKDGIRAISCGVHEHWNNSTDKKYSRNLGIGNGIELYSGQGGPTPPPTTPTVTPITTPTFTPTPTSTPTPTLPPGQNLLSQGKPASASSSQAGNIPANANDGNTTTRWAASTATFPQWWKVDLQANYNLSRVDISWYNSSSRSYKYQIEISNDDIIYSTKVDKTANTSTGDTSDSFIASGRYVRITISGCSAGGAYASAFEFKVNGSTGITVTPTTVPPTVTPTKVPPTVTPTTVPPTVTPTKVPPTVTPTVTPTIVLPTATPTTPPGGTFASTTWYLFNQSSTGVTPAGQNLQTTNSSLTGWQPTIKITTTSAYWYSPILNGIYNTGSWSFVLWSNNPGSSSTVSVELYKVNTDGSGAVLITSQSKEAGTSGGGNHATTYTFSNLATVSLNNQRLMVKITKTAGTDLTMAYNTNDFPTKLITP